MKKTRWWSNTEPTPWLWNGHELPKQDNSPGETGPDRLQQHMSDHRLTRGTLVTMAICLSVALWLLVGALGGTVPSLKRWWPLFILIGGGASAFSFYQSRTSAALTKALLGLGWGAFFLLFTLRYFEWREAYRLWPVVVFILFVAALGGWVASGVRGLGLGITAFLSLGIALTGAHFQWTLPLIPPPAISWAFVLMAIALVLFRGRFLKEDAS